MYKTKIIDLDSELESEITQELWVQNLGSASNFDKKFRWLYQNNPAGHAYIWHLIHEESEQAIGVQGISPRRFSGPDEMKAGLVADFAVNKDHRTLGPSLKLLKQANLKGLDDFDFLYGFPNKKAQPVFKRANYQIASDMVRYAKPIKSLRIVSKKCRGITTRILPKVIDLIIYSYDLFHAVRYGYNISHEYIQSTNESFDELWDRRNLPDNMVIGERNQLFLHWRFELSGQKDFKYFVVKQAGTKEVLGYVVFYIEDNVCCVADFFAKTLDKELKILFARFFMSIRHYSVDSISLEFKGSATVHHLLQSLGFRARSSRAMFYAVSPKSQNQLNDFDLFITSSDEDSF